MTEQLTSLRALEVSYVPRGANRKKFLVTKEDDTMAKKTSAEHVESLIAKLVLKNDDKISAVLKELSPEDADAIKSALKVLQAMGDKVNPATMQELTELVGATPALEETEEMKAAKAAQEVEKARADKAEGEVAAMKAEKAAADANADLFPIKKDGTLDEDKIPEAIRKQTVALWKRDQETTAKLAKVQKSLDDERDARVLKQFEVKASELKGLPVKAEVLGKCLKEVSEKTSDETFKALNEVLKAANEAVLKADPTAQVGSDLDNKATATGDEGWEGIVKAAEAAFKGETKVSKEDKVDRFLATDTGRTMYRDYKATQSEVKK